MTILDPTTPKTCVDLRSQTMEGEKEKGEMLKKKKKKGELS